MSRLAAVVLALLATAAPALTAKPRFYLLGVGSGPPVTDGLRYLAFPHGAGALAYDFSARRGLYASVRSLSRPRCPGINPDAFHTISLDALGAGVAAWSCGYPVNLEVQSLISGATREIRLETVFSSADVAHVEAVGSHWLSLVVDEYHASARRLIELGTGRWVAEPSDAREAPAFDSAVPSEQMCSPLRRVQPPYNYGSVPFNRYLYEPPYGVTLGQDDGRAGAPLLLQRCRQRRTTVLSRCPMRCANLQLSAGIVTWTEPGKAFAHFTNSKRRLTWSLSSIRPGLPGGSDTQIFVARLRQT